MNKKAPQKPAGDNQSSAGQDAGTSGIDNSSLTESTDMVMGTTSSLSVATSGTPAKDNRLVDFKVNDDFKGEHLIPGKIYQVSPETAELLSKKGAGAVVEDEGEE